MNSIWNITGRKATASFDCLADFIAAVDAAQNSPANKSHTDSNVGTRGNTWDDGVKSLAAWRDLIRAGWHEGARLAKAESTKVAASVTASVTDLAPRPVVVWGEEGDEVDVGRLNDGEDEHWMNQGVERARSCGRVATLIVGGTVNCDVQSRDIQRCAVAICAAVDVLEGAGVRVEVRLVHRQVSGGNESELDICLKEADEPLDIVSMAGGLHVCTFRRGAFRLWESLPWDIGYGYGCALDPSPRFLGEGRRVVGLIGLTNAIKRGGETAWVTEFVRQLTEEKETA